MPDQPFFEYHVAYTPRDAILYALSLGFGDGKSDRREQPYVSDASRVVPSFASALVSDENALGALGLPAGAKPSAESLLLHRPLAERGSLAIRTHAERVSVERGEVVLVTEAKSMDASAPLFQLRREYLPDGSLHSADLPTRAADLSGELEPAPLRRWLAPLVARDGPAGPAEYGFSAALLGSACRILLGTICEHDHTLIREVTATFAVASVPHDRQRVDMWQDANVVSFASLSVDGAVPIISAGRCVLAT